MNFHKKLDFLMNITRTTNSALALHTSLDASYISRLRRGERKPVRNADYIKSMVAYLTRQITEDYQKKSLLDVLQKPADILENAEMATQQIYIWLIASEATETTFITDFLDDLSHLQPNKGKKSSAKDYAPYEEKNMQGEISLHYGRAGKQEAVICFLSLVLEAKTPQTLLLYSDEAMDWLTEEPAFFMKWADYLTKVIRKGNRIKIIHTVSRNLDEMLEALTKWMPLYMTGAIEPYYYPKKRDGIFKRTLFIAPETAAVTTTSIDPVTDNTLNIFLREKKAVDALTEEFNNYLSLCKPLMRIFTPKDRSIYLSTIEEFEKVAADAYVMTEGLSLSTMPVSVAKALIAKSEIKEKEELEAFFLRRKENFEKNLLKNTFTEIIRFPEIEKIKAGLAEVSFSGIERSNKMFYTAEEYKEHLLNIIEKLNAFDNYQVAVKKTSQEDNYSLYVKEDLGAIVLKSSSPFAVFAINESNMAAAFWDYLSLQYNDNKTNKKSVIRKLQELISKISEI